MVIPELFSIFLGSSKLLLNLAQVGVFVQPLNIVIRYDIDLLHSRILQKLLNDLPRNPHCRWRIHKIQFIKASPIVRFEVVQ